MEGLLHGRMCVVKVIVVTGGIASGKSTVVQMLREMCGEGLAVFDSDTAVSELYNGGKVSRDLVSIFGPDVLNEQGGVNRDFLRKVVRNDPQGRLRLEEVVHPVLAQSCIQAQAEARKSGEIHTFLADIPLYFESKVAHVEADRVCTVALSREGQIKRLMERDACSREMAEAMLAAQAPTQEKIDGADYVFWNEGDEELLRAQVQMFYRAEIEREAKTHRAQAIVVDMNELRRVEFFDLQQKAENLSTRGLSSDMNRRQLIAALVRTYLFEGSRVQVTGVIDTNRYPNQFVLRDAENNFRPGEDDILFPGELMRRYDLRVGNEVRVQLRPSPRREQPLMAGEVLLIEGVPADEYVQKKDFEQLTALIPTRRLILENVDIKSPAMRVLDLVAPLGMGQRALVVAPPRGGKTILLKTIARSIRANYPDINLLVLLLDERPEEVTDFEETVDVPVYASTFDENSRRHEQLSELVLERARRLVEQGKDVVILLDSLTRLARGHNAHATGGRTMSGGLDSHALEKPRKFFGAARNVEEGGSLTIVATCLADTESRMDEIIFEEFKGTGNMEVRLDRELAERRIYPAISISQSGTRNDDRLYHPDEMSRVLQLRRQLSTHPGWEALQHLLVNIQKTQNNAELLLRGLVI